MGLAGQQPNFGFSERSYLRGLKQRLTEQEDTFFGRQHMHLHTLSKENTSITMTTRSAKMVEIERGKALGSFQLGLKIFR